MFERRIGPGELRAIYDEHYRQAGIRDSDSFYQWVLRKLRPRSGATLLDVACGSGLLLHYAQRIGLRAIGLDFSIEGLKLARSQNLGVEPVLADGQVLPLADSSIDYLTNLGSLEHFVNPDQGAREMARVLKPLGTAAIVLPNAFYAVDLVWWVWRKGRSVSHRQPIERFAAFNDWRELLERNGLRVYQSQRYNFLFPHSRQDWRYYSRHPRKLLNVLVGPFIPLHFSYSFLYLCRRAD